MAIKKKIKRIREAKSSTDTLMKNTEETERFETQIDGELTEN